MGQQHRKIAKRRRRLSYLERKKAKVKKLAPPTPRREAPAAKPKSKKAAVEKSAKSERSDKTEKAEKETTSS